MNPFSESISNKSLDECFALISSADTRLDTHHSTQANLNEAAAAHIRGALPKASPELAVFDAPLYPSTPQVFIPNREKPQIPGV
jgi:hypothetical protein